MTPPGFGHYYDPHTETWLPASGPRKDATAPLPNPHYQSLYYDIHFRHPAVEARQDTTDYQDALRHAEVQNAIADAIALLNEALQKLRNQG